MSNLKSQISNIRRRDFLELVTRGGLIAAFGGLLYQSARFLSADVGTQPPHIFKLRPPLEYQAGDWTFEPAARVYVGRDARGLFAVNATCTHLGCTVTRKGNEFECPCHGSRFDTEGHALIGPATVALAHVRLTLAPEGRVLVDRNAVVAADFRLAA